MQPFISLKWKFICLNDWMSIFQCSRLISPHRAKYIKMNCFIVHVFSSEKLDSYWNWKWKLAWENITVSFPKLPFPPLLPKCYESFFFHLPALIGFSSLCLSGGAGTAETAGGGGWGAVSDCSAHAQRHHQEDPEERVSFFWLIYSTGFSIFCSDDIVDVNF